MRVIAGQARGRHLVAPRASRRRSASLVRPTSDLIRGSIFSALASLHVDMTRVLDIYAGSGALGIEALSRGAQWCDFVERNRVACDAIRENLRSTGFESQARVYPLAAARALTELTGPYTLVLADPPYEDKGAIPLLVALSRSSLVEEGGAVLVLEQSARQEPPADIGVLALVNSRRHGDTAISIYR